VSYIVRLAITVVVLAVLGCEGRMKTQPSRLAPRSLSIELADAADGARCFDVVGLSRSRMQILATWTPDDARWPELWRVAVSSEIADLPAMLGTYSLTEDRLRFTPRFALRTGLRYRAEFHPEQITLADVSNSVESGPLIEEFTIAPDGGGVATEVAAVYPSAASLPENLLKFYLHFSAPMSRGEAYERIRLLDAAGRPIKRAFLELGEELWDPAGRRLTLFLDPGRIKRGLKPREDLGPVLEAGQRYTLVIDAAWRDAASRPLATEYRKSFGAGPPDEGPPDAKSWVVDAPSAGTIEPLVVRFPEPLDRALLQRLLSVVDSNGAVLDGDVAIDREETRWQFRPGRPWGLGAHQLLAGTVLEDLAGNSIARPFEVDIQRTVTLQVPQETVAVKFKTRQ
jgi:hypothetical protein